ncbi:hypothetical protein N9E28_01455 [Alphaproteobacteria bacterium]|nr:hypothetical protein [Alphaproteobacteria bacterium]
MMLGETDNWFKQPIVREIRKEVQGAELFIIKTDLFDIALSSLCYYETSNLVPLPNYDTLRVNSVETLRSYQDLITASADKFTSLLIPFQTIADAQFNRFHFGGKSFVMRNDSFELNLTNTVSKLTEAINRRKRAKIKKIDSSGLNFEFDSKLAFDCFYEYYLNSACALGLKPRDILSESQIFRLLHAKGTHLISASAGREILLIHLIGMDSAQKRAEFVLSVFGSGEGRNCACELLWNTVITLKQAGVEGYHLGGGIKKGDGLEIFKQQFGGVRYHNFCNIVVNQQQSYLKYADAMPPPGEFPGFFPPYLS